MNTTLIDILNSREDLSDYLFHFTKGENALVTLTKIYDDKKLLDINMSGVICFTESPITLMASMFDIFSRYKNPMYSPFGVGIKKDYLYKIGCRPVIYGSCEDLKLLHEDIKWRFVEYIPYKKDMSWLREWRIKKLEIKLLPSKTIFITETRDQLEAFTFDENEIEDIEFDGCIGDRQIDVRAYGVVRRSFKGISLEDITNVNNINKSDLNKYLNSQKFEDALKIDLGGSI